VFSKSESADFREVRGLVLGRPKSSARHHKFEMDLGRLAPASEVTRWTYLTILKRALSANFKMVWYVLLRPRRPLKIKIFELIVLQIYFFKFRTPFFLKSYISLSTDYTYKLYGFFEGYLATNSLEIQPIKRCTAPSLGCGNF
jgi:hypothetical protein